MNKIKCLPFLLAVYLLLCACGTGESLSEPSDSSGSTAKVQSDLPSSGQDMCESSDRSSSEQSAEGADVPQPQITINAEQMIPATRRSTFSPISNVPESSGPQFYTIQRKGKWGLVQENGDELLPCTAEDPVALCGMGHWMWWPAYDPEAETPEQFNAKFDQLDKEVTVATGYPLCGGHGGGQTAFFVDTTSESPVPLCYHTSEGFSGISPLTEASQLPADSFFPALFTTVYMGEVGEQLHEGLWNFVNQQGEILCPDGDFTSVGWFNGEALAPVERDGKWAYLNQQGQLATGFVYDPCWGSGYFYREETGGYQEVAPLYAYELWGGFVPVCREGKWGVIDQTGAEAIPCQYEGAAPYPGGAWLQEGGTWTLFLLQ